MTTQRKPRTRKPAAVQPTLTAVPDDPIMVCRLSAIRGAHQSLQIARQYLGSRPHDEVEELVNAVTGALKALEQSETLDTYLEANPGEPEGEAA